MLQKMHLHELHGALLMMAFRLRTSLCLQFRPHHIAAGAIFLAAKFLKVKLPSDGEKFWWQEFDITPRQLDEVRNQMLELYEQNRVSPSQGNGGAGTRAAAKASAVNEEQASKQMSSRSAPQHTSAKNLEVPLRGTENRSNDGSSEMGSDITDHKVDSEIRDSQKSEQLPQKDDRGEVTNRSKSGTERRSEGDQERMVGVKEASEVRRRDDSTSHKSSCNVGQNMELREGLHSPEEAIKMIDKEKVKAALEKRRKERGELTLKKDVIDEDDLIERELEDGVELAIEDEKNKKRRQSWYKPDDEDNDKHHEETRDGKRMGMKGVVIERRGCRQSRRRGDDR